MIESNTQIIARNDSSLTTTTFTVIPHLYSLLTRMYNELYFAGTMPHGIDPYLKHGLELNRKRSLTGPEQIIELFPSKRHLIYHLFYAECNVPHTYLSLYYRGI